MVFLPQRGHGWVIEVKGRDWFFDPLGRVLNRPDPPPYDPCWCESGKKFRFCHLKKQREPRVTQAEYLREWEKASGIEMCLHPKAPAGCSETIASAHSVQRMGGGLRTIARDGEVFGYKLHPYFFIKTDLLPVPELIGTRRASTFRGFCDRHDQELFRAAETVEFSASVEQLNLLNFRVIARRLFGLHQSLRHRTKMLDYDRGLPSVVQKEFFATTHRDIAEAERHLKNVTSLKAEYDDRITQSDFKNTNALVACFEGRPEFLCSDLVDPVFDFLSRPMPLLPVPAHVCAYNLAISGGWAFVLCWVGSNTAAEQLARSFGERGDKDKAASLLRFALEYTDQLFFAPDWWDSLSDAARLEVTKSVTGRLHPHYQPESDIFEQNGAVSMASVFSRSFGVGPWVGS
ncbi:MAG TPA: hypothetical protein VHL58_09005 [Thermoanaerobaculia bacterium]|nr:hypothetical protein [Thermoanaerobaculia bacterium]